MISSSDEFFFRLNNFLERVQISFQSATQSFNREVCRFHAQALTVFRNHLQQVTEKLRQEATIFFRSHPWLEKARESGQKASEWFYSKILAQLTGNVILAAFTGFLVGYALKHLIVWSHGSITKPRMMKGLVWKRGVSGTGCLEVTNDFARPKITSADEVLIRVTATSVDYALSRKKFSVCASDVVGIVEEVGIDVDHLNEGDRIWTAVENSPISEYVVCKGLNVAIAPKNMSDIDAATLPKALIDALHCVENDLHLDRTKCQGKTFLIANAVSTIGSMLIQVLSAWKAENIIAMVPRDFMSIPRLMGATDVIPIPSTNSPKELEVCSQALLSYAPFDGIFITEDSQVSSKYLRQFVFHQNAVAFASRPRSWFSIGSTDYSHDIRNDLERSTELVCLGLIQPLLGSSAAWFDLDGADIEVIFECKVGKAVVKIGDDASI